MTYQISGIPIHLNQSMSIYVHEVVLEVFPLESCDDFQAFISRCFAKIPIVRANCIYHHRVSCETGTTPLVVLTFL